VVAAWPPACGARSLSFERDFRVEMKSIQSIRGMNDVLPDHSAAWQRVEATAREVLTRYGYLEMRTPILEHTELFSRSIGETTDVVEKEMYSFEDRNGESLSLRPEATAGLVRAGLEHGLFHNQQQRVWLMGPMFRRERPQRGRFRQFWQIDVEAFGIPGPDVDAEIILISARILSELGLKGLRLELNSLGTTESRWEYREKLREYFDSHRDELDEDSLRRLDANPLRILDSKNPGLKELITRAPSMLDSLDEESRNHFDAVVETLSQAGVDHEINPRLVRGLDYYTRTVFEWISDSLGAQGAVCAGGRYDGLVELLGGRPTPAIGFAMGVERLIDLVAAGGAGDPDPGSPPHVYLVAQGDAAVHKALLLAEQLRSALSRLRLVNNCGGGSFKSQFKRADRSGALWAVVLGEEEMAQGTVILKHLRADHAQETLAIAELEGRLEALVAGKT